ncbi:mitochondrial inner membrane protein Mitofilin [Zopfochytrium polystomum]|nr:mitochondrial inner membrane protein Mitofilin [Zopfochytrium polystomum]
MLRAGRTRTTTTATATAAATKRSCARALPSLPPGSARASHSAAATAAARRGIAGSATRTVSVRRPAASATSFSSAAVISLSSSRRAFSSSTDSSSSSGSAKKKGFPFFKVGFSTAAVVSTVYVGAAIYALNDEKAKDVWIQNKDYTGGQRSLDLVQAGVEKARTTKLEDIQNAAADASKTAEKAYTDAKEAGVGLYNKASDSVAAATQSVKDTADTVQNFYVSTRDKAIATYESANEAVKNAQQTVTDFTNKTFQSIEDLKESVFGKSPVVRRLLNQPRSRLQQPPWLRLRHLQWFLLLLKVVAPAKEPKAEAKPKSVPVPAEPAPKTDEKAPTATAEPKKTEEPVPARTPDAAEALQALRDVAASLDKIGSSKKYAEPLTVIRQRVKDLAQYLSVMDLEESDVKRLLEEQTARFTEILRTQAAEAEKQLLEQAAQQDVRLAGKLAEAEASHAAATEAALAAAAEQFLKDLDAELARQSAELERQWTRRAKAMVDRERDGRLARLDHLALKLKHLERISLDASDYLASSHSVHAQRTALQAISDTLHRPTAAAASPTSYSSSAANPTVSATASSTVPFAAELRVLRELGRTDAVVSAALAAIPDSVARRGIAPVSAFATELDGVAAAIRRAQLMPERGGPVSYAVSWALSWLVLPKRGLVAGDDVEAVLARTRFYLVDKQDLDAAARELNQLKGWPKKMAADWLAAAREHLEVKQALEVVELHLRLKSLSLV